MGSTASNNNFPAQVLRNSLQKQVSVELKTGMSYNGILSSVDTWMNMTLTCVTCTMPSGEQWFELKEVVVRGNAIRMVRCMDEAVGPPPATGGHHAAGTSSSAGRGSFRGRGGPPGRGGRITPEERQKKFGNKRPRNDGGGGRGRGGRGGPD